MNAEVLERSLLLNSLIQRKSISWTKLFADIEGVKPDNVRLIQVRLPQINSRNEVTLDMEVGAQNQGPVIEFLKHLQDSPLFGPTNTLASVASHAERAAVALPGDGELCPETLKSRAPGARSQAPRSQAEDPHRPGRAAGAQPDRRGTGAVSSRRLGRRSGARARQPCNRKSRRSARCWTAPGST